MDTWELMKNWDLVLPPSRPAYWQLNYIRELSKNLDKKSNVAVLGSTPEFRDLLFEIGFSNVFVFDKSISFNEAMSLARIYKNKENFIHGNWLETIGCYPAMFSLILSDLTSGNIQYDERPNFYSLITNALANGGFFCDKVLTHPFEHLKVDALISKYAQLPLNLLNVNYFSCEMLFCSELLEFDDTVNSTRFYTFLKDYVKPERVKAFVKKAPLITPYDCVWFYGKKWDEIEKYHCPDLKIVSIIDDECQSPYFRRAKLIIKRKT